MDRSPLERRDARALGGLDGAGRTNEGRNPLDLRDLGQVAVDNSEAIG